MLKAECTTSTLKFSGMKWLKSCLIKQGSWASFCLHNGLDPWHVHGPCPWARKWCALCEHVLVTSSSLMWKCPKSSLGPLLSIGFWNTAWTYNPGSYSPASGKGSGVGWVGNFLSCIQTLPSIGRLYAIEWISGLTAATQEWPFIGFSEPQSFRENHLLRTVIAKLMREGSRKSMLISCPCYIF